MASHLLDQFSATAPDRVFITTADGRVLTYGGLNILSARLANALQVLGVKPGDRVAAQVEKSPEAIALYLACVRAGAAWLPLNTAYTRAELANFVEDAEPALFVAAPGREDMVTGVAVATLGIDGHGGSLLELAARQSDHFDDVARGPNDLAAILYTSGTTGRSKGAMLSHENLASNARALARLWQFTERDVLLHALPIYHTHGLFVATNTVLMSGAAMLFLPKPDLDQMFRLMPQATVMMGVPTFYTRLLSDARLTQDATRHMRLFVSGSAPLLSETHRDWQARTGHVILERYGMTETNMNTSNPYEGARIAGTVGPPLPGVDIRITDPETGHVLAKGEIGMIEVRGPNVFTGYWRMPEKTKAEFRSDGFFITGDLGVIDTNGYIAIVGRGKDLVISGGFNVYPKEVEGEIDALPGVVESAVIGVAHPDFGEGVTAVVAKKADAALTEAHVIGALKDRLAAYKLPKRVLFVDDLPRNAMGKVQKALLRETYKDLYRQNK
ncbi:MAG: malonyl-CoA synthase [Rhizomicrobium sp.]